MTYNSSGSSSLSDFIEVKTSVENITRHYLDHYVKKIRELNIIDVDKDLLPHLTLDYSETMTKVSASAIVKLIDGQYIIRFNRRLLEHNKHHIAQTTAHELSHLVAYIKYGRVAWNHGFFWQEIMLKLNVKATRYHNMYIPPKLRL